jgi:hypothetical protein
MKKGSREKGRIMERKKIGVQYIYMWKYHNENPCILRASSGTVPV